MRLAFGILTSIALIGLHVDALYAWLHPRVSREYKAYYMDKVTTDWRVPRYQASSEEGIEFARPGCPDFVAYSFGISRWGSIGRWTDTRLGLQAGFEFSRAFSGPVCVVVAARPSDAMRNQHATLGFGGLEKDLSFGQEQDFRLYALDFELSVPATKLALHFPKPLPRISHDNPIQAGVELERIRIFAQRCSEVATGVIHRP